MVTRPNPSTPDSFEDNAYGCKEHQWAWSSGSMDIAGKYRTLNSGTPGIQKMQKTDTRLDKVPVSYPVVLHLVMPIFHMRWNMRNNNAHLHPQPTKTLPGIILGVKCIQGNRLYAPSKLPTFVSTFRQVSDSTAIRARHAGIAKERPKNAPGYSNVKFLILRRHSGSSNVLNELYPRIAWKRRTPLVNAGLLLISGLPVDVIIYDALFSRVQKDVDSAYKSYHVQKICGKHVPP
ncbi:hypothetical protein IW261DRAFT_1420312 [Armillaria novae-zelandiae]|uniref:Uncharacterized protein n=1 Tax=Armillaria novae-zelandiae TaxID=153914 RepID=A0AA39UHE7_9AGAR|nr:hypothetical protein IW261DRAFT_1420312 [Armillaria novae-zelandiae]